MPVIKCHINEYQCLQDAPNTPFAAPIPGLNKETKKINDWSVILPPEAGFPVFQRECTREIQALLKTPYPNQNLSPLPEFSRFGLGEQEMGPRRRNIDVKSGRFSRK